MHIFLLATAETNHLPVLHEAMPGPLLPILNQPVMARVIEIVARAGHRRLTVSLCHASGSIITYFGNGKRWGVDINYITQRQPWGTAGAVRWAVRLLHETTLLLPADAILDLDIAAALAFHQQQRGLATLLLHAPVDGYRASAVQLDAAGRVSRLDPESAAPGTLCNTGAYIFEPQLIDSIPPLTQYDWEAQLLPALLASGAAVYGYPTDGYWNPLHTPQAYQEAQQVFLHSACALNAPELADPSLPRVRYPSIDGRPLAPGVWAGAGNRVHPQAHLVPPVCIGDGCWIGRAAVVGPEAVLGAHLMIDAEATVRYSTIMEHTYIGQLVNLSHRVVHQTTMIDPRTADYVQIVDPFLLAVIEEEKPRYSIRIISFSIALFLFIFTLPLFILISLLLWLGTGGPVLAPTPVVGQSPRARHHTPGATTAPLQLLTFCTRQTDGTMTLLGRWLTALGLVRLPALWNVLTGDLALIGVKPLHPTEAAQLTEAWQQKRFDYPSGLTGLWYVQTDTYSSVETILVVDAYYAATQSWRSDLTILWQTPAAWFRRRCAAWNSLTGRTRYRTPADEVNS